MKRRFLCGLSAAASLLLAICANAVTTTKNIDIVVTHSSGAGAVITSLDYYLPSIVGGAPPGAYAPLVVGQVFRAGDVPSGFHVAVTDASGNPLQWQEDMIAPVWNDPNNSSLNGSMRHGVFSVLVPATGGGNSNGRIQFQLVSGAPSSPCPSNCPRSISDISAHHNFLIKYDGVMTHPSSTGIPTRFSTYGSNAGNCTCHINDFLNAGQYVIRANGPVRMSVYTYGFATDDATYGSGPGTPDKHLYCEDWFEVYTDASNPANVSYIEQMPLLSQPFGNPADGSALGNASDPNADYLIGQASLYDGATVLRDFSANETLNILSSEVDVANNQINTAALTDQVAWSKPFRVHLVSGVLPGGTPGLSEGAVVYAYPYSDYCAGCFQMSALPRGADFASGVNLFYTMTNQGNGSFQLIPLQPMSYYEGFFITADNRGRPILEGHNQNSALTWTAPVWLQTNLDGTTNSTSITPCALAVQTSCSQKAYWQSSGFVPGFDITRGANMVPVPTTVTTANWYQSGNGYNPYYTPGSVNVEPASIDSGGGGIDEGSPWPDYDARYFVRMGATNWSTADSMYTWIAGLSGTVLPVSLISRLPTGTNPPQFIPWDNGPDDLGSTWNVGYNSAENVAGCPNDKVFTDGTRAMDLYCIAQQAPWPNNWWWALQAFNVHASNYHWPTTVAYLPYLLSGRDYMLKMLRYQAQRVMLTNNPNTFVVGGHTYYNYLFPFQAQGEVVLPIYAAAFLGPATDPEIPYFQHRVATQEIYLDNWYTTLPADARAIGSVFSQIPAYNNDGFNWDYYLMNAAIQFSMTRDRRDGLSLKTAEAMDAGFFDDTGHTGINKWGMSINSAGAGAYEVIDGGWSWPNGHPGYPNLVPPGVPDPRFYMAENYPGIGSSCTMITNGNPAVFTYDEVGTALNLQNGDTIQLVQENGPGVTYPTSCSGPPEMCAYGELAQFTVTNINTTARTFNVLPPNSSTPLAITTTGYWNSFFSNEGLGQGGLGYRYTHDVPGQIYGNSQYVYLREAGIAEAIRTGITPDATYGTDINHAWSVVHGRASNCCGVVDYYSFSAGYAKLSNVIDVPVYPPLTGP